MTGLVLAAVLVGLVALLFVLALAEASLLHVRHSAVAVEAEAGDAHAIVLLGLLDDLPRVINAVLLSVLLAQVTAAAIAGALAANWFGGVGVTVATFVVTLVLFIYGEAIPKTLAVRQPLTWGRRLAQPIRWLAIVLRPFVSVLVRLADLQLPGRGIATPVAVSEQELRHLADEAADAGHIEESDAELIDRAFTLGDLSVGEILVPREKVVAVSADTAVEEAMQLSIAAGHRRLPVYRGDLDTALGIVRLRDLVAAVTDDPEMPVGTRTREALEVAPDSLVIDTLRAMQESGRHLAVVTDKAGRTVGIVTIEDAVEELVGAIDAD